MLCFPIQNVSRRICGEACPAHGSQTVSAMFGSWSDRPRSGTASSGVVLLTFLRIVILRFAPQPLQIPMELIVHESLCRRSCIEIAFCNSACADGIVMAASRLLGAAAACVILLSFAAGHQKSYWNGCIKAALVICHEIFSILALR